MLSFETCCIWGNKLVLDWHSFFFGWIKLHMYYSSHAVTCCHNKDLFQSEIKVVINLLCNIRTDTERRIVLETWTFRFQLTNNVKQGLEVLQPAELKLPSKLYQWMLESCSNISLQLRPWAEHRPATMKRPCGTPMKGLYGVSLKKIMISQG